MKGAPELSPTLVRFFFMSKIYIIEDISDQIPVKLIWFSSYWQCFFPQYALPFIETPFFILNSAYDVFQVIFIFQKKRVIYHDHANVRNLTLLTRLTASLCRPLLTRTGIGLSASLTHRHAHQLRSPSWKVLNQSIRFSMNEIISISYKNATPTDYRVQMVQAVSAFYGSMETGFFINSCFAHCQSELQEDWLEPFSPRIQNKVFF